MTATTAQMPATTQGPAPGPEPVRLPGERVAKRSFVDWLYGPTALVPADEPPMCTPVPLPTAP